MLLTVLYRLVVGLTILSFLGGMTLQLMPPKAALAASAMPAAGDCAHMTATPDDAEMGHKAPCKSDLPECIKQMRCLGTPSLPLRLSADPVPFAYAKVVYWTPAVTRDSRSIKPDLFPPIGP